MMDVYGELNINKDIFTNFSLQAREIENNIETKRILKHAINRLKDIEKLNQSEGKRPEFNMKTVEAVLDKLERDSKVQNEDWTVRELRLVSYYLSRFQMTQHTFEYAVNLLDNNWRDVFVSGITFFLMNSWNICPENLRNKTCDLLRNHLLSYTGSIKKYQLLKSKLDLLDSSGPIRLSALIRKKKMLLEDAPSLLGYKNSALSFPYFSDVIIDYIKKLGFKNLDSLEVLFNQMHRLDRTRKLVCAHMIEYADNVADAPLQIKVSKVARKILGDINSQQVWTPFSGATSEERSLLTKAKNLVTAWYARKSVEAFFEICVQDSRRRKCWLEYVQNVSDFRIVGSLSTKTKLQSDSTLSPLLRSCFIETNSRVSTTAALVLFMKDKVFVEFSDVGSLYIYNSRHNVVKSIKTKRCIDSTSDLKYPSMNNAVEQTSAWSYSYSDEGKISHRGEWEDRFQRWMRNKMNIIQGQKLSYDDIYDNISLDTKYSSVVGTNKTRHNTRNVKIPNLSLFDEDVAQSEENIPYPGTRIRTEVKGIQGKCVFEESCCIILDTKFVYLFVKNNGRIYYLCENPVKKILGCNLWMASLFGDKMYEVKISYQDRFKIEQRMSLGRLSIKGNDVVFTLVNGKNVVIHTQ